MREASAYVKTNKDPYGITTKGDGIIYISPTVKSAAGQNATLGKFASSVGMTLNAAEMQLPGGTSTRTARPARASRATST